MMHRLAACLIAREGGRAGGGILQVPYYVLYICKKRGCGEKCKMPTTFGMALRRRSTTSPGGAAMVL